MHAAQRHGTIKRGGLECGCRICDVSRLDWSFKRGNDPLQLIYRLKSQVRGRPRLLSAVGRLMEASCLLATVWHPQLEMCQRVLAIGVDIVATFSCGRAVWLDSLYGLVLICDVRGHCLNLLWIRFIATLFFVRNMVLVLAFLVRRPRAR